MLVNDASQVFTLWNFLGGLYHKEWMLLVQFTVLQDNEISSFIFFFLACLSRHKL